MRLARGSGLDGLAGIAPAARLGSLRLLRPLLDTPKARLRATLEARDIPWIEDPSNQSPAFERTRLRAAGDALAALGLTGDMLALSARRLQRARAALDSVTDSYCAETGGVVHTDRCGFFRIDRERLSRAPEEIVLRVLARCIAAAGGSDEPVPLGKLEPIVDSLRRGKDPRPAAGRWPARSSPRRPAPSRSSASPAASRCRASRSQAAQTALWDGRFAVAVAAGFAGTLEVRALGAEGLAELRRLGPPVKGTRALHLVPSFWRERTLLAVPAIDFWAMPDLNGLFSATFVGLRYNSGVPGSSQSGEFGAFC